MGKPLLGPKQGKPVHKPSTAAKDIAKVRELGFTTFAFKFSKRIGATKHTRYVYASETETVTCRKNILRRNVTLSNMIDCGIFDFDDEVSNAVTPDDVSCTTTSAEEDEVLLVDLVDDTALTEMLPDATCVAACETDYPDNAVIACDEVIPAVCRNNVGDDAKDTNLTDTDIMSLLCYAYE